MIGFGSWPLGGIAYGPVSQADALLAVEHALDSGIRLFDTANIYGSGRAEAILGMALDGVATIEIVTKGPPRDRSGKHQHADQVRSGSERAIYPVASPKGSPRD